MNTPTTQTANVASGVPEPDMPSGTTGLADPQTKANVCARCGMEKKDWKGNNAQGIELKGKTYCCNGCAQDTGCTCAGEKGTLKKDAAR